MCAYNIPITQAQTHPPPPPHTHTPTYILESFTILVLLDRMDIDRGVRERGKKEN